MENEDEFITVMNPYLYSSRKLLRNTLLDGGLAVEMRKGLRISEAILTCYASEATPVRTEWEPPPKKEETKGEQKHEKDVDDKVKEEVKEDNNEENDAKRAERRSRRRP